MEKRKYRDYQEKLLEDLKDPQVALAYLNAAMLDEDERVFLIALKDVLDAQDGNISEVAKEAKLNRENMYRMLSKKGNPKWSSIRSLIKALNLHLTIEANKYR